MKKITISPKGQTGLKGPLMLASNHPNSFLDAILLGTCMDQPVHFISRGDVFANPRVRRFLEGLNMIPIFRIRDGKEKLSQNDEALEKSVIALSKNDLLLIFVEGVSLNQTALITPLKKGGSRILQTCWQQNIPAKVLPVWVQYSSYSRFAKTIDIRLGRVFDKSLVGDAEPAVGIRKINMETEGQLLALSQKPQEIPYKNPLLKILLFIPAMLAAVLHAPLYLPVQALVKKLSADNVHYDSMLLAFLMVLYPFYTLLFAGVLFAITGNAAVWALCLAMPLLAKAFAIWR